MFRPFPTLELRAALAHVAHVAILDRNVSPGHGGIFAEEVRAALYDAPSGERPRVGGFIIGLGGRDVTPAAIEECLDRARAIPVRRSGEREDVWVGVKP
jgi:pyruvate/2-oxoacid:ferredoxin oxidoreductase alpha subunit